MKVIHHYRQNNSNYLVIQKRFFFFKWTETYHQPILWRMMWRGKDRTIVENRSFQEWLQVEADKLFK